MNICEDRPGKGRALLKTYGVQVGHFNGLSYV